MGNVANVSLGGKHRIKLGGNKNNGGFRRLFDKLCWFFVGLCNFLRAVVLVVSNLQGPTFKI